MQPIATAADHVEWRTLLRRGNMTGEKSIPVVVGELLQILHDFGQVVRHDAGLGMLCAQERLAKVVQTVLALRQVAEQGVHLEPE